MCGIVGIANKNGIDSKLSNAFARMLYVDVFRGKDSTGIAEYNKLSGVSTYKKALASYDFIQLVGARNLLSPNIQTTVLLGHNRAATKGIVNDDNAHPFTFDGITGVHNGSLITWDNLAKGMTVDSRAIFKAISEVDDPIEVIPHIKGAFALVWIDDRRNRLCMVRNSERPLWIQPTVDGISWASEPWIYASCEWTGLINTCKGDELIEDFVLPVGELYEYDLQTVELVRAEKVDVYKPATPPKNNTHYIDKKRPFEDCIPSKNCVLYVEVVDGDFKPYNQHSRSGYVEMPMWCTKGEFTLKIHTIPEDSLVTGVYKVTVLFKSFEENDCNYEHYKLGWKVLSEWNRIEYLGQKDSEEIPDYISETLNWFDGDGGAPGLIEANDIEVDGVTFTYETFEKITEDGCQGCGSNLFPEDAPTIKLIEGSPICGQCATTLCYEG